MVSYIKGKSVIYPMMMHGLSNVAIVGPVYFIDNLILSGNGKPVPYIKGTGLS